MASYAKKNMVLLKNGASAEYSCIPILTSDDGNILCSSYNNGASPYVIYLGNESWNYLQSWYTLSDYKHYTNQFIGYDFIDKVTIQGVALCEDDYQINNNQGLPHEIVVQYSNDNSIWIDIKKYTFSEWKNETYYPIWFDEPISARYFRVYIYDTIRGHTNFTDYAVIIHRVRWIMVKNACLYQKDNTVYGMNNNIFTKLSDNWSSLTDDEKKALFISTNYQTPTVDDLATLGKFKVLKYAEDDGQQTCTVTAVPKDQLILPQGLISLESFEGIDKVTLASTISDSGACKLIVTTDLSTYQTYDFTAKIWQAIDHTDLATVKFAGIDAAQLVNIDRTGWDAITTNQSGIGFAYLFSMEATTDKSAVDKLDLQVDMKGCWDKAVHGSDYKYGYPKNNILRVQLLANGDYKINYQK